MNPRPTALVRLVSCLALTSSLWAGVAAVAPAPVEAHTDPGPRLDDDEPDPLRGVWRGATRGVVVMYLRVDATRAIGSTSVHIRYGSPRDCTVDARLIGRVDGVEVYDFQVGRPVSGRCISMHDDLLELRPLSHSRLEAVVVPQGTRHYHLERERTVLDRCGGCR